MNDTLLREKFIEVVDELSRLKIRLDTGAYSKAPDVLERKARRLGNKLTEIATDWANVRDIVSISDPVNV